MKTQKYTSAQGSICEYKNCKQEVDYILTIDNSENAYYQGKLRCLKHKKTI